MSFLGADTDQLRDLAGSTKNGAGRIEDLVASLDGTVQGVTWVGPDADAFRERWNGMVLALVRDAVERLAERSRVLEENAEDQDSTSGDDGGSGGSSGDGDGSIWDAIQQWLEDYEPQESDGFFGDLLGGPESGLLGNLAWNTASAGMDLFGIFGGTPGTIAGLPMDVASMGIGLYDAMQSFQDGELYGTADGLITYGINAADTTFGVLSLVPFPPVMAAGEIGGAVTGTLDTLWSGATALAQLDAISGGDSGGSTSRYLLDAVGVPTDVLDGAEGLFADGSAWIRDQVPVIDPIIDGSQNLVENIIPDDAQGAIEGWAEGANDWIDDKLPW